MALARLVACAMVLMSSSLRADNSLPAPAPASGAQALAAAQKLWSAVRAHDRKRIAAAVGPRVRMWASQAGLATDDDYQAEVERARFAERMMTLELASEPATDWHAITTDAPLTGAANLAWVGASVQSRTGEEGHGARIGVLAFGVGLVDGRARVVAFDVKYTESRVIYSR